MSNRRKAFSELKAAEQEPWLERALKIIYPGVEPAYPDHEKRVREKARELYYAETDK